MFSTTATIEPGYLVNVGSMWLRFTDAEAKLTTLSISHRPMTQKAMAAGVLIPAQVPWCCYKPIGLLENVNPPVDSGHARF